MRRHHRYRHSPHRAGTHPHRRGRAFTILEVVGALALFMGTVGMLTGATLTALTARGNLNRAESLDRAMARMLDAAATTPFAALAANSGWDVPEICDGELAGVGTNAASCPVVDGRTYRVTWTAVFASDAAGADGRPTDSGDSLTLTATTTRSDGSVTTRSRKVQAPTPGWRASTGILRLTLTGQYADLDTPLLLIRENSPTTIVAAGRAGEDGTVLLRGKASACRASSPCRVALSTGDSRGFTPTHSLSAATVVSPSGQVVFVPGQAVDMTAHVFERGSVDLAVSALNATSNRRHGPMQAPPPAGSVCVWATFYDGIANQQTPLCNTADPRYIALDTYVPDATKANVRLPFPSGAQVRINVDKAGAATCPIIPGQRYFDGGWTPVVSSGVCTSWTWGYPTSLGRPGQPPVAFPNAALTIPNNEHHTYEMIFSGNDAAPAAGDPNGPLWAKPRNAANCPGFSTGTCSPPATNPCAADALQCKSNAANGAAIISVAPTSPAPVQRWPFAVVTSPASTRDFTVTMRDYDKPSLIMYELVTAPPAGAGSLQFCPGGTCTAAVVGAQANLVSSAGVASLPMRFTASATPPGGASFKIKLTSNTGLARIEEIGLPTVAGGWIADPLRLKVDQGRSADLSTLVRDHLGDAAVGVDVTWSNLPSGMTLSTPTATTDSTGVATTTVTAATTPAGTYTLRATIGARSFDQTIVVSPRIATIAVTAGDGPQGATAPYSLTAKDKSGALAAGWTISLAAELDGVAAEGVFLTPPACVTDTNGACAGSARISPAARRGPWQLTARSTGVESTDGGGVGSSVAAISGSVTVTQGTPKELALTVQDGSGAVMADAPVTLSASSGLTFSPASGITDGAGVFKTAVTASSSATLGTRQVTATVGTLSKSVPITVKGKPSNLVAGATSYTVTAGGAPRAVTNVRARTAGNVNVANTTIGATFDIPGFEGEMVTSSVTTDASGVGTFYVEVPAGAPKGVFNLTLTVVDQPSVRLVIPVTVQ